MNKVLKFENLEIDGIDTSDYPDFCDATAVLEDESMRLATEDKLNEQTEDGELPRMYINKRMF
jgi:hypothetical protein